MDKKNTMLLTVIAVATLLVAVVGATFAYFSVAGTQNATTDVNASTGKIGAVNVTKKDGPYSLVLTAQDMLKQGSDKNYYAIGTDSNGGETTGGKWSESETDLEIATISLSGAGTNDTVKCDVSVAVSLSGTMVGHLQKGDAFITISGTTYEGFSGVEAIDLKEESSSNKFTYLGSDDSATASTTFTGSGKLELKGGEQNSSETIKAKLWIVNKEGTEQNYLAGKTLKVSLTTQVANCQTTSTPAAA